jgi:predicted RNase H-like HicB family nuclease
MGNFMNITFETELETDGRWIAEVPEIPGILAYGQTERDAIGIAEALALRALAEQIESGEASPMSINVHIAAE